MVSLRAFQHQHAIFSQLRLQGNEAARDGRLQQAIDLYSRAMSLAPAHGMHLLLANRSGARLTIGQSEGAVEDAYAALQCAPVTFSTAVVRLVRKRHAQCHIGGHVIMQSYASHHLPPNLLVVQQAFNCIPTQVDALYACQRYDEALEVLDQSPHARGFARSSDYASLRNAVEQAAAKKAAAPAGENREQQAGGTQGGWLRWGG